MDATDRQDIPEASLDWAYFMDMDGTLVDIADSPDAICVDRELLGLIGRLHRACDGAAAVISGRSVADIEHRLGDLRVPVAGQHGLERRDAQGRLYTHPAAPEAKQYIQKKLEAILASHPGLLLEDKGLTLALHYRQAPRLGAFVHQTMKSLVAETDAGLGLQSGKCVVEVKPLGFNKGSAIDEFMGERPFAGRRAVFIGDDITDEYGFAAVNRRGGISIKVGSGTTEARWRLPDVAAVREWLGKALIAAKEFQ